VIAAANSRVGRSIAGTIARNPVASLVTAGVVMVAATANAAGNAIMAHQGAAEAEAAAESSARLLRQEREIRALEAERLRRNDVIDELAQGLREQIQLARQAEEAAKRARPRPEEGLRPRPLPETQPQPIKCPETKKKRKKEDDNFIYRSLSGEDRQNYDAGLGLQPAGEGTGQIAILQQVRGQPTGFISASLTQAGAGRFYTPGNGMVQIDVNKLTASGSGIVPNANLMQTVGRIGEGRDVENVRNAQELLITRGVPRNAMELIRP
jgi:hypothetical protein